MVESGLGYAVCINNLANTSAESPLCFRPLYPEIQSRLVLVWKKYQLLSKAEQMFLERVKGKIQYHGRNDKSEFHKEKKNEF
jgi:DNA-binding transcriptional LysR family regulator